MNSEILVVVSKGGGIQRKGTLNGANAPRVNPSTQVVDKSKLLEEIKDDAAEQLVKQLQHEASLMKPQANDSPVVVGDLPNDNNNSMKKPGVKRSMFASCFT